MNREIIVSKIKVIAHRGLSSKYTENTIAAFKAAVAAKVDMIELDVHETQDGHFIVYHDDSLNSDTAAWRNLTYDYIRTLKKLEGRAPLLSESLKAIGSTPVSIEIKSYHKLSNIIRELKDSPPPPGSVVSSFDLKLLKDLHNNNIKLPLFLIIGTSRRLTLKENIWNIILPMLLSKLSKFQHVVPNLQRNFLKFLPEFLDGVAVTRLLANKAFVRVMQLSNKKVYIWTVDKTNQMKKFIKWGVNGIITNYPDRLQKL